jgi:hypothetical protein
LAALVDGVDLERRYVGVDDLDQLHDFIVAQFGVTMCHPAEMTSSGNVPRPLSTFVGRRKELAELAKLVAGHRLVTIAGPGGAGKTRIVTELARLVAPRFEKGALFAD